MSVKKQFYKRSLGIKTALITFGLGALILSVVSVASVNDYIWNELGACQNWLRLSCNLKQTHCWLCGMSHAFRSLWKGELSKAIIYNDKSPYLFVVMIILSMSLMYTSRIRSE
jgi:hypothetical protein